MKGKEKKSVYTFHLLKTTNKGASIQQGFKEKINTPLLIIMNAHVGYILYYNKILLVIFYILIIAMKFKKR